MQWMKGGDQCSRVFFRKVTNRRAAKRIFQISDEAGQSHTDPEGVSSAFVGFYQRLLGGSHSRRVLDLAFLRSWARHVITGEEALELTCPFTKEDVKQALFDIEEDKALGPDGYSSGFFKAAWPIIGEEVSRAVLDFFATGRLLKQVNSTLISLIPKVTTPTVVAEFRPISCCNVLYKIITKLLVLRIRVILEKLVSPSQNAFVPGRLIGDNILMAQELFSGYNQMRLPPRCALKVDLRKAYDTVEWDLLLATLRLSVSPRHTSPFVLMGMYMVILLGLGVLRQGDPMSPYLFVLVMEVLQMILQQLIDQDEGFTFHWKCGDLGLFQLCFADDLLLLCHADIPSVTVVRRGLELFATLSRLHANPHKSHLILSKATQDNRDALFRTLDYEEGHLPLRGKQDSIWVDWISRNRLQDQTVWTASEKTGSWGWRKLLKLCATLRPHIQFRIGDGMNFSLWKDPWHSLGPLITQFPRGPQLTYTGANDPLATVIEDGQWSWPLITDIECLDIIYLLPDIHGGDDSIEWMPDGGNFSTSSAYNIFDHRAPTHFFILWLAILGKLPTLDKPWLAHLGWECVLCSDGLQETHEHLFFTCCYSRRCVVTIRQRVRFPWPYRD
ncbi:UNVERIFIED_CONTAM: LINE-1 retrotransposable element O protein [Sesamum latifolium]|uniref:LINE-1 retrotransposable element O protein n=1 Tax=Sesamum latifolium TaxID=2727402 RepID=A0AAW2WDQ9_9LAMI